MPTSSIDERLRALQEAREAPERELVTVPSADSVRNNAGQGLATMPFLTINDIMILRQAGYESLEDLEQRLLEVPEDAWIHVVELVDAGVVKVTPEAIERGRKAAFEGDGNPRCLAYTKSGSRCRNKARDSSKYCASHKGYRPSQAELEARKEGLIATP